jgi:hypothetical protein
MMVIDSLEDLERWGFSRGEAYAMRLGQARKVIRDSRRLARAWPMSNETKRELNSQIFAARKVVNSTLECIARWERRNNQDWRIRKCAAP